MKAENQLHIKLPIYHFEDSEVKRKWETITGMKEGDAMLVRPDGFVALRLAATDAEQTLVDCLSKILCV